MLRAAQLYYRLNLTQDEVGKRLGVSRFKVGRLLDRALREDAVRIEIVHPDARLVGMEDILVQRFSLQGALVVDVPATGSSADDEQLVRERVAAAAAGHLATLAAGWRHRRLLGPHHAGGRSPGCGPAGPRPRRSCSSTAPSPAPHSRLDTRRSWSASGPRAAPPSASWPRPAIVGSAELRRALEADPSVGETLKAARRAPSAVFGMGILGPDSVHVASGYLDANDLRRLQRAGAVGDVLGRFLTVDGTHRAARPGPPHGRPADR